VFSFAHSAMPDMALLLALTGAMAAYVRIESGGASGWLLAFYALVGIACLSKGAAGLLPLVIVLAYTLTIRGAAGLRPLVSAPGLALLLLIAVPWWVVAAVAGRDQFVDRIVFKDQLLWYFRATGWSWRIIPDAIYRAVAVTLPWCFVLPFAIRSAIRETDAAKVRRLRLLIVWLATVFAIIAVSGQQRERYYLPLCPALALLIGWWYSTLVWRRRALAFAVAWVAVVTVGGVVDTIHVRRLNAATDLEALRAALGDRSGVLYATDVPELALTFNLDRPVVGSKSYREFQERAQRDGRLIISDRALQNIPDRSCMRQVAAGTLDRRPLLLLSTVECRQPPIPPSGPGAKE